MNWGIGQVYQETQANREEIAGLRVDVAALDSSIHADMTALKTAVIMHVNEIRREIGTTRSALRNELTAFKDATGRRFDAVDRRLGSLETGLHAVKEDVAGVKQSVASLDVKLDECLNLMRGKP